MELRKVRQRRAAGPGELHVGGEPHRQLVLRYRHHAAAVAIDHGNGRAPVALAGDAPIAQPKANGALAPVFLLQVGGDAGAALGAARAAEGATVGHHAVGHEGLGHVLGRQGDAGRVDHRAHRKVVLPGELEVPLVVGRDRHDRARAVLHQHEVGHVDGDLLLGERVDAVRAGEDALLLHVRVVAPGTAHALHVSGELLDRLLLRRPLRERQGQRMLRRQ